VRTKGVNLFKSMINKSGERKITAMAAIAAIFFKIGLAKTRS
jgi:hypothetical protein